MKRIPKSWLAIQVLSERYLHTRKPDAIHYDFTKSRDRLAFAASWDESILSTAANP